MRGKNKKSAVRLHISAYWHLLMVLLLAGLALFYGAGCRAKEEGFPSYEGYVNDYTGTISERSLQRSEELVRVLEERTSCEVAVVVVQGLGPYTIEEYAEGLFAHWKIGKKDLDNGVLLLVAMDDRELRIEVGYGLESVITDLEAGIIIEDVIVPSFRAQDYDTGIYNGLVAIANHIYKEQGSGELPYQEVRPAQPQGSSEGPVWVPIVVVLATVLPWVIIFSVAGSSSLRRRIREHRCPQCRRVALTIRKKVLLSPTFDSTGRASVEKSCKKCPFFEKSIIILPELRRGSSGSDSSSGSSFSSHTDSSGSSSSSSDFGGGSSGGGGASGRW